MVWKYFTCHGKIWKSYAGLRVRVKWPAQETALCAALRDHPLRTTNEIRAHICAVYGTNYSPLRLHQIVEPPWV